MPEKGCVVKNLMIQSLIIFIFEVHVNITKEKNES